MKKRPDVTLAELCERVKQAEGLVESPSMMGRELQLFNLPRKKSRSTTANAIRRM